jgi:hypothetical protein
MSAGMQTEGKLATQSVLTERNREGTKATQISVARESKHPVEINIFVA